MITHSIKAPGYFNRLPTQHHPRVGPAPAPPPERMEKLQFTRFIESIKLRFKPGELITFSHFSDLEGTIPPQLYTLVSISELWFDCKLDESLKEPRCMLIQSTRKDGQYFPFHACPGRLRSLSERELNLVHLRDQTPLGTA